MKYTNKHNIPWSVAVWLASDTYDHNKTSNVISATSLMKSIKQITLARRLDLDNVETDISSRAASQIGTAVHTAIEGAWTENLPRTMNTLGVPEKVANAVIINPTAAELEAHSLLHQNPLPVYMEQRSHKTVDGYVVSGKYDFVMNGRLEDFKTTKTYSYTKKTNDAQYQLQGSIYRWLNPTIILDDHMTIEYIFTDWAEAKAKADPSYPQQQCLPYSVPLLSLEATDAYIKDKINLIASSVNTPEEDLPFCTSEELWRGEGQWKYYKDPEKTSRSTRNFDNPVDAAARLAKDGYVGKVVEVPGQVKACKYCNAFDICEQKNQYLENGTLII